MNVPCYNSSRARAHVLRVFLFHFLQLFVFLFKEQRSVLFKTVFTTESQHPFKVIAVSAQVFFQIVVDSKLAAKLASARIVSTRKVNVFATVETCLVLQRNCSRVFLQELTQYVRRYNGNLPRKVSWVSALGWGVEVFLLANVFYRWNLGTTRFASWKLLKQDCRRAFAQTREEKSASVSAPAPVVQAASFFCTSSKLVSLRVWLVSGWRVHCSKRKAPVHCNNQQTLFW